ncbi:hypothetical protein C2845_PM07G18990 [Panicum miliaceum]|uniref:Uncharacterized protein n=1 Tax=Panicum miliaceum TaxID=4540 RepID=A0A3L6SK61_PANMI|nr:hypothetical protein C2845_PM07G18990 [Panicum miliaceum]
MDSPPNPNGSDATVDAEEPTTDSGELRAQEHWLDGMDPNSTFLLNIKPLGNRRKARKDMRYFAFEKVVDSDLINYKDFIESVVEQYPPGYLEVAHIQYYDESSKTFPEVKCDKELMSMFEKHMLQKRTSKEEENNNELSSLIHCANWGWSTTIIYDFSTKITVVFAKIAALIAMQLMLIYMYRCRSRSGSNQPEPISEEHEQTNAPPKEKAKRKRKVKQA